MSRFQAMTSPLLHDELETLRAEMGLRDGQKAELLRELAAMASWLISQARAGRTIEARGPNGVEVFRHPALSSAAAFERVVLAPDEAERLVALLDEDGEPSPALRATLKRLIASRRRPPKLRWSGR